MKTAGTFIKTLIACLTVLLVAASSGGAALAQANKVLNEQTPKIEDLIRQVDGLAKKVDTARTDDNALVDINLKAGALSRDLLQSAVPFRPRLSEINSRLDQLGAPPKEGDPAEPDTISVERQNLAAEKTQINELLGRAENASVQASGITDQVNQIRRDLFTENLTRRYDIDYELAGQTLEDFRSELGQLWSRISNWLRFVTTFKLQSVLGAAFFALLAATILLVGGRRLFSGVYAPDPANEEPSYFSRLSVAFWSTLLPALAVAVFLGLTYLMLDRFQVLRAGIDRMLLASAEVIAILFFVHRLARAILSPHLPAWRLLNVADRPARTLLWLVTATTFFAGLDHVFGVVNNVMGSPLSLTVGKGLVATVIVGLLVLAISFVKPFQEAGTGAYRPWPRWLRLILAGLGLVTILAALIGYIGFAQFLSQQMVITAAILATMYLGFRSAHSIAEEGNFEVTAIGRKLVESKKFDHITFDQLGLAASLVINFFVLLLGIPLLLLQWGFQFGDIQAIAYRLATEIRIGNVSFSLVGILTGIAAFIIAYFATRWFQGWLDGQVLKRAKFDSGVRNSIRTAVGYLGIALAILMGISVAGIDLSNLALVAGALSLGIGFGLQNIVSNFVSGLILLAERPFKAGDWIEAGAYTGLVKKISVRATEIETFQRQTIILPNSELINAAVGNRTHRNNLGRLEIPVGVSYDSDPVQVYEMLLDIGKAHPLVLKNPEPQVFFANFGASSLDFELRVFIADVFNSVRVQTDLRMEIFKMFKDADINIPFPQQDLHIKSGAPEDVATFIRHAAKTVTLTPKDATDMLMPDEDESPVETESRYEPAKKGRRRKKSDADT